MEENDFGFTFAHEEDLVVTSNLEEQVISYKNKLNEIRKTYIPLLERLSEQPDKPFIKWPNRKPTLDTYREKLLKLTEPF